jgi:hypothetical protein
VINISGRDVVACERGSIVVVEHSDSECVSLQKCSGSAVAGGRPKRAHWTIHTCGRAVIAVCRYPHVCIGSLSLAADTDGSAATDHG